VRALFFSFLLVGPLLLSACDKTDSTECDVCGSEATGGDATDGDLTGGTGGTSDSTGDGSELDGSEMVSIPIAGLNTSKTSLLYDSDGVTIKYFAMIGADGQPHVAIDACENCQDSGELGYRQEGDEMVCNVCDQRFAINELGTTNEIGGCWPGHLPITLTEDEILIDPADIEAGAWYFTR